MASAYDAKDHSAYRVADAACFSSWSTTWTTWSPRRNRRSWASGSRRRIAGDQRRRTGALRWNARTQITPWGAAQRHPPRLRGKRWGGMCADSHGELATVFRRLEIVHDRRPALRRRPLRCANSAWEDRWTHQTDLPRQGDRATLLPSAVLLEKYVPIIENSYQSEQNLTTGKPIAVLRRHAAGPSAGNGRRWPRRPLFRLVGGRCGSGSRLILRNRPSRLDRSFYVLATAAAPTSIRSRRPWTARNGRQVVDIAAIPKPPPPRRRHTVRPTDARYIRVSMLRTAARRNRCTRIAESRLGDEGLRIFHEPIDCNSIESLFSLC